MILIAPDKFKGSMTAGRAALAIIDGLKGAGCRLPILYRPMADGGEGMPDSLGDFPVVSSSSFVGAANEALCSRPLLDRSSHELGRFLMQNYGPQKVDAPERVWVAVGGTMTADAGAGLLEALGARFFDLNGELISQPISPRMLPQVGEVDFSAIDMEYWRKHLFALADVEASLLGPGLSALDFIAQKGASAADAEIIRTGFYNFAKIAAGSRHSAIDGAGGGLGFALATALGCSFGSGAQTMLDYVGIPWEQIMAVVSGEGRIDNQTKGGKVVETLRREAEKRNIPFFAIGGYVEPHLRSERCVSTIESLRDYNPDLAEERLRNAATRLFRTISTELQNFKTE